jgi:phage terminase large subunit-like protein
VLLSVGGDLRLVFAAPPQHGKTEVTLALIAFLVLENPGRRWAYITYNQKRANAVSRKFRRVIANAGEICSGGLAQTYLPGGGQILFVSIDGGLTGEPVDGAAFIDDPYKNRKEADSQSRRELIEETYRESIETRVHPGASIFLLATRWHPQDLSGTLTSPPDEEDEPWEYINLRAIAEGETNDNGIVEDDVNGRRVGEPLFPAARPLEYLNKKRRRVGEFAWEALYQGRPRPKGGKVFHGQTWYTEYPKVYAGCFGIDLAYSAKTSGDFSVCLELWRELRGKGQLPWFYIIHVDRGQVEPTEFALTLRARNIKRPQFKMHWRASGTEQGSAKFLREKRLPIVTHTPPGDKFVSATEVSIAWNDGRVLVPDPEVFPETEEWCIALLDLLHNFTGVGQEHDDEVDALGTAHDMLNIGMATGGGYGSTRKHRANLPKPRD